MDASIKKKILFIQPTMRDDKGKLVKKRKMHFVGLAYPILAALLPDDWEAEICLETIEDVNFDSLNLLNNIFYLPRKVFLIC